MTPLLPVGGFDHLPRLIQLEPPVASASSGMSVHLPRGGGGSIVAGSYSFSGLFECDDELRLALGLC